MPAVQASVDALRDDRDRVSSAGLAVCGSSLIAAELVRVDVLVRGRAPADAVVALRAHLRACGACRARLAELR